FSLQLRQEKNGAPLEIEIDVEGRDVLWRGTAFDHIGAEGTYADDTLTVRGIRAGRGTERFEGGFVFEPHFRGVTFSFHSTFYLPDILQLIGPEVSRIGQWFRFRGDSKIEAAGFLDLSPQKRHDFHGSFAFQDLVLQWLSLNQLEGNLRVEDQRLSLPDLRASLEGGTLQADFQSEETFSEQGHFVLDLELKNMDLYKVITKATDLEDTPYRGNLSLDLDLTGKLRDTPQFPRSQSYQGGGRVEIREGSLFRIPLLLGLSQLLSKLVNGFGYASQSDFTADFEIGDGRISSKELFLQGNILSIAGPGSYRFEDRKISADLKIHLLKEGVLSDALKLILWPIRKLIEIQLTGTLDQPSWQPKNLPKEIFGK
ncbi:MAG: AsmA-like C-terminal region-containing protein, partial [Kiritimatiellia bacterium]